MTNKQMTDGKTSTESVGVTETQNVRILNVFGYKIKSNSCTALDYSLYVKKFNEYVQHVGTNQDFALSMNHIKIWQLLDEALIVEINEEADTDKKWLVIETADFRVSFDIPKGRN